MSLPAGVTHLLYEKGSLHGTAEKVAPGFRISDLDNVGHIKLWRELCVPYTGISCLV